MSRDLLTRAYMNELHAAADRQSQDGQRWHTVLRIRAPQNNAERRMLEAWQSNFAETHGQPLRIEFAAAE